MACLCHKILTVGVWLEPNGSKNSAYMPLTQTTNLHDGKRQPDLALAVES